MYVLTFAVGGVEKYDVDRDISPLIYYNNKDIYDLCGDGDLFPLRTLLPLLCGGWRCGSA